MTTDPEGTESSQKLVWIKAEDPEAGELEKIRDSLELPDGYKAIITTDGLGLIEASEMKQELEKILDG